MALVDDSTETRRKYRDAAKADEQYGFYGRHARGDLPHTDHFCPCRLTMGRGSLPGAHRRIESPFITFVFGAS